MEHSVKSEEQMLQPREEPCSPQRRGLSSVSHFPMMPFKEGIPFNAKVQSKLWDVMSHPDFSVSTFLILPHHKGELEMYPPGH